MGPGRLDVLKEVNLKGERRPHVPKDYLLEKTTGLGEQRFIWNSTQQGELTDFKKKGQISDSGGLQG